MEQGCTADGTSVQSSSRACFLPLSNGAVYNSTLSAGVPLLTRSPHLLASQTQACSLCLLPLPPWPVSLFVPHRQEGQTQGSGKRLSGGGSWPDSDAESQLWISVDRVFQLYPLQLPLRKKAHWF